MSAPVEVATVRVPVAALPRSGLLRVELKERVLCLAHTESGGWYTVDDSCTHEDCSLSAGALEGEAVECPCHGSCFDLATGNVLNLPAVLPLQTYPTAREHDVVVIRVER